MAGLARFAGAHIYTEENESLMADNSVVALHSLKSGHKTIKLPGEFRVTDAITGKLIGEHLAPSPINTALGAAAPAASSSGFLDLNHAAATPNTTAPRLLAKNIASSAYHERC